MGKHEINQTSLKEQQKFMTLLVIIEIFCIIFHSVCGQYKTNDFQSYKYPQWQDVNVMIFVGFGFLMTFLRRYNFGAVAYTFLIGAISFQLYPIWELFFERIWDSDHEFKINMNVSLLILSSFCSGSILIAYGAIIGKVTPFQLLIMTLVQTIGYTLNERIGLNMGIADIGGSMVIHTFGAFFGLVVSKIVTPNKAFTHAKAESNYVSDITAFLGAIFLSKLLRHLLMERWLLRIQAIKTELSLILYYHQVVLLLRLFLLQQHLEGTCADMHILPIWAISIGFFSGLVSTFGFNKLQSFLEEKIKLHDSCGVLNLHALPGFLGGIFGSIAASQAQNMGDSSKLISEVFSKSLDDDWNAQKQAKLQIAYLFITLILCIIFGFITGLLMKLLGHSPTLLYDDGEFFHIPNIQYEDLAYIMEKVKETHTLETQQIQTKTSQNYQLQNLQCNQNPEQQPIDT
ncbi:rhesus type c glycoprotein, putative [Ichthyophthirius multifiliis]|uniref:Rhesus type c glycoprotein, putative n=1 Tax=Ichthyophthirius multifiliis TaxID=5932 RepID=G0QPE1_ICHMU|nr:rhesus type c glycoprotein, putative [Ichthyophthirius multifiliis]EGR32909.1 rhesus type c glycoprotein, putative [Ichthyophthirius multifiliis]|eukprot:XP_004036895.1 rhesus type c glycoprotein, putative [Ichthyophthirius multifiliis]